MKDRMIVVPPEEYLTPHTGWTVHANRWWIAARDGGILYHIFADGRGVAPQCNDDERIARMWCAQGNFPVEVEVRRIPVVFERPRDSPWWREKALEAETAEEPSGPNL